MPWRALVALHGSITEILITDMEPHNGPPYIPFVRYQDHHMFSFKCLIKKHYRNKSNYSNLKNDTIKNWATDILFFEINFNRLNYYGRVKDENITDLTPVSSIVIQIVDHY
jgi:hypothetical protein